MKSLILRSSVALACALSLAACGGGGGNLLLGGSVVNLTKPGLELQNKSGPVLKVNAFDSIFSFPELLGSDEDFDVQIKTQPTGAKCEVKFGKGRTGAYNVTSVVVSCITNTYNLGATISGLDVDGLVLVNGSDRGVIAADRKSVAFTKVADGSPYGITVLTPPNGRTCSVANGVGTMGSSDVTNVAVTCV